MDAQRPAVGDPDSSSEDEPQLDEQWALNLHDPNSPGSEDSQEVDEDGDFVPEDEDDDDEYHDAEDGQENEDEGEQRQYMRSIPTPLFAGH